MAKVINQQGIEAAAPVFTSAAQRVDMDTAKELPALLFHVCERKGWADSALLFNSLGSSWLDLEHAARGSAGRAPAAQGELDYDDED